MCGGFRLKNRGVRSRRMMNGVRRTPRQVFQDTVSETIVIQRACNVHMCACRGHMLLVGIPGLFVSWA